MIDFKGISFAPDFTVKSEKKLRQAQDFIDSEVVKRLEEYTPVAKPIYANHGKMSRSHKIERPGVVINTEPTARKEYYTNKGSSGGKHGKRWLDRMKADHKDDILKGLKK